MTLLCFLNRIPHFTDPVSLRGSVLPLPANQSKPFIYRIVFDKLLATIEGGKSKNK